MTPLFLFVPIAAAVFSAAVAVAVARFIFDALDNAVRVLLRVITLFAFDALRARSRRVARVVFHRVRCAVARAVT